MKRMRTETAVLLVLVVGVVIGASIGWGSFNECRDQLEQLEWERDWAYEAYDKYRTLYDDKWEAQRDAGFERMVKEQVESVFWPCGRPPLPKDLCDELKEEDDGSRQDPHTAP